MSGLKQLQQPGTVIQRHLSGVGNEQYGEHAVEHDDILKAVQALARVVQLSACDWQDWMNGGEHHK